MESDIDQSVKTETHKHTHTHILLGSHAGNGDSLTNTKSVGMKDKNRITCYKVEDRHGDNKQGKKN